MAAQLTDTVEALALSPIAAVTDGQSSSDRPMADVILGLNYAAALKAKALRRRGIRFSKMIPSGPLSDDGRAACGDCFSSPCGGC